MSLRVEYPATTWFEVLAGRKHLEAHALLDAVLASKNKPGFAVSGGLLIAGRDSATLIRIHQRRQSAISRE
jgi:hypothetical protein